MTHLLAQIANAYMVAYLLGVQIPICMYLGYRTAKRTHRSVVNWLLIGFLAAIPPVAGPIISLVAWKYMPEPTPKLAKR